MKNIDEIKERAGKLAEQYGLDLLVLFGSQVTGFTHKESDVDVAYLSDRKLSFEDEILLNTDLTEIFGNDKVSLVNLRQAPPLLAKRIVSEGIVLYAKTSSLFSQLYAQTLRTYEEALPLFELRRRYLDYKLKQYQRA